ncbi:hypothetical protein POKO110462_19465 [Pontibacter korlensis]|uniref:Uncharacterized protein n=1 Tax=Pontibacter korlensis TaxID=400092 RepID=A0A0E3UUP5_9BACT|nr:hypothetical protein [Pontibacter korlensis]AKD01947.1 hypothetical protein PKOR_00805 [Pontibacter korlensis]
MGIQDILFILFILLLAHVCIEYHVLKLGEEHRQNLTNLWYYHLLFGVLFFAYISIFGGDAKGYWAGDEIDIKSLWAKGPGTYFIYILTNPFAYYLQLSFFSGSILFAFIGYLGLQFFYAISVTHSKGNLKLFGYKVFPLLFFLPNLHFWSSGVGKDTLSFFSIGLFSYASSKPLKRGWAIVVSLFLMYYVRPHIAIMILLSYGISILIDKRVNGLYRVLLTSVFILGFVVLFDDVMEYVKLEEVSTDSIEQFSSARASNLNRSHTGSAIDITSYPLPLKIFTFLYRPLFFDVHNITSLLASFESLYLLALSFHTLKAKPIKKFKSSPFQIKALTLFLIIATLAFSSFLGNLGIILRMKNMVTPGLLLFCLYSLTYKNSSSELNQHAKTKPKIRLA